MGLAMSMVEFVISHEPRLTIELEITRGKKLHMDPGVVSNLLSVQLNNPPMNVTLKELSEIPESYGRSYCMNCSTQEV